MNVQIETDDKVVNVSWDYNPQKNVSFTVYWCSKRGLVSIQAEGLSHELIILK